jgi:hypothetical protein
MTKSIIVLLNLLGLLIFELFYGENVTVIQKTPAAMEVGTSDTISVKITKGELTGFAKLQQDIPDGFKAEMINSKSGTFSVKDNVLKIIWISLPADETFEVTYLLTAVSPKDGSYELSGKFSYIEQNERQSTDYTSPAIIIGGEDEILITEVKENKKNKKDKKNKKSIKNEIVGEGDDFVISREIKKTSNNDKLLVELTLEKEEINSFGKIEEYIPLGYIASENESNEGFFSFKNNVVKILWMALPFGESITVSYYLEKSTLADNVNKISGKFSYLKNEQTFEEDLAATTIPLIEVSEGSEIAQLEETTEEVVEQTELIQNDEISEDKTAVEADIIKSPAIDQAKSDEIIAEAVNPQPTKPVGEQAKESLEKVVSNIPSPETGISYKVQIAAGKKEVASDYFVKRHNINEKVSIEFHDGWRKYTVGKYPVYKQARDKRNIIWENDNNISDAFVTAYNQGNRITVQEALMISKQQWFK